ncbi:PREDICTED: transcription elongation factor, mitochondrial-like [Priapulus caudatus]|uniref:Transcription elongation factor, mitochondrial-like n=1 Tax=Priapulus caudatus TaxID=37621 RepID=A0ABM1EP23_PRICU|nr:PREDICTED: transcription elongation factor, mitochondrial-like [Priapulus caudatus]
MSAPVRAWGTQVLKLYYANLNYSLVKFRIARRGSQIGTFRYCFLANIRRTACTKTEFDEIRVKAEQMYSKEEGDIIVNVLNTSTVEELKVYRAISQASAKKILQYRTKRNFQTVSELLNIDRMSFNAVKNICDNVLHGSKEESGKKAIVATCTPAITNRECQNVESLVSMDLQQDWVTFVHMDRQFNVLEWYREPLLGAKPPKYNHALFLQCINNFVRKLPKADIYTFENKVLRYQTQPRLVTLAMNMRTIEAMVTALLSVDVEGDLQQKVYTLKNNVVSQYFQLMVGGERVSGQQVVGKLLEGYTVNDIDLIVPERLRASYQQMMAPQREQMCASLMQALVFYKLVVFKKSKQPS